MTNKPRWLPDLVLFGGDWIKYEEILYSYFKNDFIDNRLIKFMGLRMGLKKYPTYKNKEATFWHFISEGEEESERVPDLRRCERIRWPRPIMENIEDQTVRMWENIRGNEKNICLCYGDWEYLIVLRKRKDYILPWTTYCPYTNKTKLKWQREFNEYHKKANTAL